MSTAIDLYLFEESLSRDFDDVEELLGHIEQHGLDAKHAWVVPVSACPSEVRRRLIDLGHADDEQVFLVIQ